MAETLALGGLTVHTPPMTNDDSAGVFPWWDDAVEVARVRAIFTGLRHRVRGCLGGGWLVEEAGL